MNTYTDAEVIQDIIDFEGVEITLESSQDNEHRLFYKLYSDFYKEPFNGPKTKENYLKRCKEYIINCIIPNVDKLPDLQHKITFYYLNGDKFYLHGYADTEREILKMSAEVKNKTKVMLVYNREDNVFITFGKKTH